MKQRTVFWLLIAVTALHACSTPDIEIDNAWIRTPPPGMNMTAAYFAISNQSADPITLVSADSDAFAAVTLHESRMTDGVWSMVALSSLPIAAGDQLSFEPGGLHLMMMEPQKPVSTGNEIAIRLHFADGKSITVSARVLDSPPK